MSIRHSLRRTLLLAVVLSPLACLLFTPLATGRGVGEQAKILRVQAEQFESIGNWAAAADKYEELFRLDRSQTAVRDRYQFCLRRFFQVVRFHDKSYRKDVLSLRFPQAVRLYEVAQRNLLHGTLDKDKVSPGMLFWKGVEEYRFALASPDFCTEHLGGLMPAQTQFLRDALQTQYSAFKSMTAEEAVESVREVVMRSVNYFPSLNPTTVVMEFLCGACLAMDDYTAYLTPRQLRELCATLKGRAVGVGLRLTSQDSKIIVAHVLPGSPAALAIPGIARGDQILSIDGKPTTSMTAENAAELLEGEEGSLLELLIASPTDSVSIVLLRRQELFLPSVYHEALGTIGHIKIHCFQETTLPEFELALAELLKADCKALLLDLRGNPGGLLDVSVEIAKRFLPSGIILSTQHHDPKSSKVYRSDNPTALTLPLVVLVDGDTASSAEVLAGALKDNGRATLVGQTTYGKGCAQGLLTLPSESELRSLPTTSSTAGTGGIRVTIARFFSPSGQPYTGRGVEPDVPAEGELALYQARQVALKLAGPG